MEKQLEAFVSKRLDQAARVVEFTPITGGYSRFMARFFVEDDAGERRGFVLRADPPAGQSILETDRSLEWAVLSAVAGGVSTPIARWFDATGDELGSPAIILDLVDGDNLLTLSQAGTTDSNRQYTDRLATLAASIHTFDSAALPAAIPRPTSWNDYIDQCIQSWLDAEGDHAEHDPFMRLVAAWLDANRPPASPLTTVHGDFQAPNILVDRTTGEFLITDWEITRVGDPREDMGWWTLAATSQPPDLIANDSDTFYSRYRELTGFAAEVVNPATVAYFTVLSSAAVFFNLIRQTASMTRGGTTASSIAYMTNAMPFMHGVWIDAMRRAGAWGGAA